MAVANQDETANTLTKLIPGLAYHAGASLAGIICFGIAQRIKGKADQSDGQPIAQRG